MTEILCIAHWCSDCVLLPFFKAPNYTYIKLQYVFTHSFIHSFIFLNCFIHLRVIVDPNPQWKVGGNPFIPIIFKKKNTLVSFYSRLFAI